MELLIAILIAILQNFTIENDFSNHCESGSFLFKPGVEFDINCDSQDEINTWCSLSRVGKINSEDGRIRQLDQACFPSLFSPTFALLLHFSIPCNLLGYSYKLPIQPIYLPGLDKVIDIGCFFFILMIMGA